MLGTLEDVESIGPEVFLRAFRFAPTYRYPQKFSTWLFTITRNLAINNARRRKRSPVRNVTELNLEGGEMTRGPDKGAPRATTRNLEGGDRPGAPSRPASRATDDVEKQEEIARVLAALDDLPSDQKEVIALGVFQDRSYADIAEITPT